VLLRIQVAGKTGDAETFLREGERCASFIRKSLQRNGVELESMDAVLDFGCGCGRVARNWSRVSGPTFFGSDYNGRMVRWCNRNLPSFKATRNAASPPLQYDDESFDLLYALSVFTHLTVPLQTAWRDEFDRVLKPGGYLFITMQGDRHAARTLLPGTPERAAYDSGEAVVLNTRVEGTNMCGSYTPRSWVEGLFRTAFDLVEFTPGDREVMWPQDLYLFQKRRSGQPQGVGEAH